jgi:hypothetical protein
MATTTLKAPKKTARRIATVIGKAHDGSDLVRVIEDGGVPDYYRVRRTSDCLTSRFEMVKVGSVTESYHVDAHPSHESCECRGFLRWNVRCRHIACLAALEAAGKLS